MIRGTLRKPIAPRRRLRQGLLIPLQVSSHTARDNSNQKDIEPPQVGEKNTGPDVPATPAPDPKIDRRRNVEEPTLFSLEQHQSPIKPGTPRAEHSEWEALVEIISSNRISIKVETQKNGSLHYTVPALGADDQALLTAKRFANRTNSRLAAIYDIQQREIRRALRWLSEQGRDPSKLIFNDNTVTLGDVSTAVRTLLRNWVIHPDVRGAIDDEKNRRIKVQKERAEAKARANERIPVTDEWTDEFSREEMLDEAAKKYPSPDQPYTDEVSEFTRLLRELAPEEDLQAAARRILATPAARDDVNSHTVELATAYSQYIEEVDYRMAYLQRGGRGGR